MAGELLTPVEPVEPAQTPAAVATPSKQGQADPSRKRAKQARTAESPSYTRLTDADRICILKLHDEGLTLTIIAQRLNRSVSTVHEVVQTYTPTTDLAKRKLAAGAEDMADNVLKNGRPGDHVRVLEGLEVLKTQDVSVHINTLIGMPGQPVPVPQLPDLEGTFATKAVEGERKVAESLRITGGSDNQSYVTQPGPCK